jgi:8-oxo-dGTP pyrophosphatase MutT (NUDIX family)
MIAEHDGRALLGRQPPPPGRYSALAGFWNQRSIEEAVARELFEEAGVRVRDVRYIASQPWPFPSSLMIACVATALDDRLAIDDRAGGRDLGVAGRGARRAGRGCVALRRAAHMPSRIRCWRRGPDNPPRYGEDFSRAGAPGRRCRHPHPFAVEAQFLDRAVEGGVARLADHVAIEFGRREAAAALIAFQLGHVDPVVAKPPIAL